MKKHIPNTLTSLNLLSGSIAAIMAFNGDYFLVVVFVIIAAIFDFSDGFAARLLKAYSPMGKELDSLADMVSFGFVPGLTVFRFLSDNVDKISHNPIVCEYLPYMAFLITIFSALRLAKFNIDTRQSESFIGLNTPANTLFWVSFCYGLVNIVPIITSSSVYVVLVGIVVFSLLLTSEVPMFSLKIKSLKFKGNEYRYFFLIFIIATLIFLKILGIAASILFYIALSLIESRTSNNDSTENS